MAWITVVSRTQSSVTLRVDGLNTSSTYLEVNCGVNGRGSSGNLRTLPTRSNGQSDTYTVTGLSAGTTYSTFWTVRTSSNSDSGSGSFTTDSPPITYPVGDVSYVSLSSSSSESGKISASWNSANNATSYSAELYSGYGTSYHITTNSTSSTYTDFYGLEEGTTYTVKVFGRRSGESNGGYSTQTITTTSFTVGNVGSVSATASSATRGRIDVTWWSASNATSYGVEVYRGNTTSTSNFVTSETVYGISTYFTGLEEGTLYTIKAFGKRSGYSNGGYSTTLVTTTDSTAPTISFSGMSGLGGLQLSWYASDSGGLRPSNTYRLYVGTRGGTSGSLVASGWTNSTSNTWVTDANGSILVANQDYWVGVRAYDNSGNESALLSRQITYKITRPNNWAWQSGYKYVGTNFNITASEWILLGRAINQFRLYGGLSTSSFTEPSSGTNFTATIFNQYRTAIAEITPKATAPPSIKSKDSLMLASDFNLLVQSLNSIT